MVKRVVQSPAFLVVLFLVALALVLVGGIGAAQSAPRIQSADWRGEVELTDVSTALVENGKVVADSNGEGDGKLLQDSFFEMNGLAKDGSDFAVGTTYKEELAAKNDKGYEEYIRVTVTKYWVNEKGEKVTSLDPGLIDLHFVEGNGWTIDHDADTPERTVLYYSGGNNGIVPVGDTTTIFTDTIRIDPEVLNDSAYNGMEFRIKAVVDAVQTHNADQARIGAWGTML